MVLTPQVTALTHVHGNERMFVGGLVGSGTNNNNSIGRRSESDLRLGSTSIGVVPEVTLWAKLTSNDTGLEENAIIKDVGCVVVALEEDVWPPPIKTSSVGVEVVFAMVCQSFIPILRYKASA